VYQLSYRSGAIGNAEDACSCHVRPSPCREDSKVRIMQYISEHVLETPNTGRAGIGNQPIFKGRPPACVRPSSNGVSHGNQHEDALVDKENL